MDHSKIKDRSKRAYMLPFCLCGFIVLCACGTLLAQQAELITASGSVEVLLEGADEYTSAEEGMTFDAGDKIKVGSGGSAEISFNEANTNVVRLSENTDASITLSGDEKMDVSIGEVFASVSDLPSGSSFEISTPTAVSGARGTDWVTKVSDEGTDVEAVDSVPYVKHFESAGRKSSQMTLIQPGQMTTVKRFQPPMQPRPMNFARQQQWKSMKQDVRRRAGEAVGKRRERPQFDRRDFIQKMKDRKGPGGGMNRPQGEYKPLRSGDRPEKPFERNNFDRQEKPFHGESREMPEKKFLQERRDKPESFNRQDKPGRFDDLVLPEKFQGREGQYKPKPKIPVVQPRPKGSNVRR
jgi:hypothetical protein